MSDISDITGIQRGRFLLALSIAWTTFWMVLRGWDVESYERRVRPAFGRQVGSIRRCLPIRPGDPPKRGWRVSSEGDTWQAVHATPFEAFRDSPGVQHIARRLREEQSKPIWRDS